MKGGTDLSLRAGKCVLETQMSDKAGVDCLPPTLLVFKSASRSTEHRSYILFLLSKTAP